MNDLEAILFDLIANLGFETAEKLGPSCSPFPRQLKIAHRHLGPRSRLVALWYRPAERSPFARAWVFLALW